MVLKSFPDLLAGVEGLEPPTPGFGDRCSDQLSYTPVASRGRIRPPDRVSRRKRVAL